MDADTTNQTGDTTTEFEQALEQIILGSFATGVPIEGVWEITVPVADAPDWVVSIEKTYSETASPYEPTLLEE